MRMDLKQLLKVLLLSRTCCDFALEVKGSCEVMLGSAAEIAATARCQVAQTLDIADLLFVEGFENVQALQGSSRCSRAF